MDIFRVNKKNMWACGKKGKSNYKISGNKGRTRGSSYYFQGSFNEVFTYVHLFQAVLNKQVRLTVEKIENFIIANDKEINSLENEEELIEFVKENIKLFNQNKKLVEIRSGINKSLDEIDNERQERKTAFEKKIEDIRWKVKIGEKIYGKVERKG
jgi:hypothetical protein